MKEIEKLRSRVLTLRDQMAEGAQSLTTFSSRLGSKELIDDSEYDETMNIVSKLRTAQAEFCEEFIKLCGGTVPHDLGKAESMISDTEDKLNKKPLIDILAELKSITVKDDEKIAVKDQLRRIIEDLSKKYEDNVKISDISNEVTPYETIVKAVKCNDEMQRYKMANVIRSLFPADLINAITFGDLEYVRDPEANIADPSGQKNVAAETKPVEGEKQMIVPPKANDPADGTDSLSPKPWTLEQEDLYFKNKEEINDSDMARFEKFKALEIKMGLKKCPFEYELNKYEDTSAINPKHVKRDLEKYSKDNLRAALNFSKHAVNYLDAEEEEKAPVYQSLLESGYLNSVSCKDRGTLYFISSKGKKAFQNVSGLSKAERSELKEAVSRALEDDFLGGCVCAENNIMAEIGLAILKTKIPLKTKKYSHPYAESRCRMGGAFHAVIKQDKSNEYCCFLISFFGTTESSVLQMLRYMDSFLSKNHFGNIMIAAYDFVECEKLFSYIKECYPEKIPQAYGFYSMADNKYMSNSELEVSDNGTVTSNTAQVEKPDQSAEKKEEAQSKEGSDAVLKTEQSVEKESSEPAADDDTSPKDAKKVVFEIPEKEEITPEYDCGVPAEIIKEKLTRMIRDNKIYCACAYLMALSKNEPDNKLYSAYSKLAYAVDDPAFKGEWISNEIMHTFENTDEVLDGIENDLYLSAALRMLFYSSSQMDYDYQRLSGMVKPAADSIAPEINILINELKEFRKNANGKGVDTYANYRIGKQLKLDNNIKEAAAEASDCYQKYIVQPGAETINNKRFVKTKEMITDRKGNLATCLKVAADDDRNMVDMVSEFLTDNKFLASENKVSEKAIRDYIDNYWEKADDKHKSCKIQSDGRNNLIRVMNNCLTAMLKWMYGIRDLDGSKSSQTYEKEKKPIFGMINNAIAKSEAFYIDSSDRVGMNCVLFTLRELRSRMDGSYSEGKRKLFYTDFLKYGNVMLDEDYLPWCDNDCTDFLDRFSLANRVSEHSELPDREFSERLDEILGKSVSIEDSRAGDYGCACLIINCLKALGKEYDHNSNTINDYITSARSRLASDHLSFIGTLELDQSYGRIDDINFKETMLAREEKMRDYALENNNFGYYKRFIKACTDFINSGANMLEEGLKEKIGILKEANEKENNDDKGKLIARAEENLKIRNYTAAEDMLNRIERGDLDDTWEDPSSGDTLSDFFKEFDDNYMLLKPKVGGLTNLNVLHSNPVNKDERASNELIRSFPIKGFSNAETIKKLLERLGFKYENVKEKTIPTMTKAQIFDVSIKRPYSNTRQNYSHPIAPFGSLSVTDGFRVVCLSGKYSAEALIKNFKELGDAKHCLILMNYSLQQPDRRELSRRMKKEAFSNIFILIDPIVIRFLAKHYSEATVNRMLMEVTMPFSYYQPYVSNPAQALPVEMFIGRRNQLNDIKSPTGANIVYGGRQLGKTALLQMAKTEIDKNENNDRAVYIQVKGLDRIKTAEKISYQLVIEKILPEGSETNDWEMLRRSIDKRLRDGTNPIPYLLILIDEADTFIESCKAVDYDPLTKMEDLQINGNSRGKFKYVIAGLRNVVRFEKEKAQSNNSVLARAESLNVAPLTAGEARELLETPLRYLGIRFPKDKTYLISNILAETNYFPGLIHSYCAKLVDAMKKNDYAGYNPTDTPPYEISEAHIKKVLADQEFNQDVRQKLNITLKLGDDNYYFIIANIMAFCFYTETGNGFTASHVYDTGIAYEVKKFDVLTPGKIAALMDEMCELNLLTFNKQTNTYSFARHRFIQILGKQDEVEQIIMSLSGDNYGKHI